MSIVINRAKWRVGCNLIRGGGSTLLNGVRRWASQSIIWPGIEDELLSAREAGLLKGVVLNAGAGTRDISHLVDGILISQDIRWDKDDRDHIDIFSSLTEIPRPDDTFDTIVCIAVLEHVDRPQEIVSEFYRVTKPGGHVIASVPFLQPEHKVPTDFQRYTSDGLNLLFAKGGFEHVKTVTLFSVYHTLHWILYEILIHEKTIAAKILRYVLLPPIALLARNSARANPKVASAFQIIVRKPEAPISGGALFGAKRDS
jgi:SAM-dependent methyltransferase